jgi:hypothetical protein
MTSVLSMIGRGKELFADDVGRHEVELQKIIFASQIYGIEQMNNGTIEQNTKI